MSNDSDSNLFPNTSEHDSSLGGPSRKTPPPKSSESIATLPADPIDTREIAGKYRLVNTIGEGGMGTVWLAEQRLPVQRMVAIKLIKAGMDSKSVVARFDAERQALALMDHPNIAKILDGGISESGTPYFVMELVKGVPITQYCDSQKLGLRERLELFIPICRAIQHAHQKGIIHRDIKPSNILVTQYDDKPIPKVIDFGVAKAMGKSLTDLTLATGFGVIGTPQYMSPEQATLNQADIDTRSDIYSLGVLLYELLTGYPPFTSEDLQKASYLEILRMIREVDPPRPSIKVSTTGTLPTIAQTRSSESKKLTNQLRSELDWVVMKSLEKDRTRRYESASAFAADIERYLKGEAVEAYPPSKAYRLKKFIGRHRGGFLAVTSVLVALALGLAGTAVGLLESFEQTRLANKARDKAQEASKEAINSKQLTDQVLSVLLESLKSVDPDASSRSHTAVDVINRMQAEIQKFELPLQFKAKLRRSLAETYASLGMPEEAVKEIHEYSELGRDSDWPERDRLLLCAQVYSDVAKFEESLECVEKLLALGDAISLPEKRQLIAIKIECMNGLNKMAPTLMMEWVKEFYDLEFPAFQDVMLADSSMPFFAAYGILQQIGGANKSSKELLEKGIKAFEKICDETGETSREAYVFGVRLAVFAANQKQNQQAFRILERLETALRSKYERPHHRLATVRWIQFPVLVSTDAMAAVKSIHEAFEISLAIFGSDSARTLNIAEATILFSNSEGLPSEIVEEVYDRYGLKPTAGRMELQKLASKKHTEQVQAKLQSQLGSLGFSLQPIEIPSSEQLVNEELEAWNALSTSIAKIDLTADRKHIERLHKTKPNIVLDASLSVVGSLPELKMVDFAFVRLAANPPLKSFSNCKKLEHLNFWAAQGITDESLREIKDLPSLTFLNIGMTQASLEGIDESILEKLEFLYLNNTRLGLSRLSRLRHCKKLRTLSLYSMKLEESDLAILQQVPTVEAIEIGPATITEQGLEILADLPNIKRFDFRGTPVSEESIAKFRSKRPDCVINR